MILHISLKDTSDFQEKLTSLLVNFKMTVAYFVLQLMSAQLLYTTGQKLTAMSVNVLMGNESNRQFCE